MANMVQKKSTVGNRTEYPNDSFTLLFWLQPFDAHTTAPMLAYYSKEASHLGVAISRWDQAFIAFLSHRNYLLATNTSPVLAGTWYYVGVSYDNVNGNAALYLNGTVVATAQFPKDASYETDYPLIAGRISSGYDPYDGRIAWIQLYDIALSVEQVKAVKHFTEQSIGKSWHFY